MKAVVLGGTGAVGMLARKWLGLCCDIAVSVTPRCCQIGEHLVGQLLAGPAWSNVVTIGRREVQVPKEYQVRP